jgi:hypothetical protein
MSCRPAARCGDIIDNPHRKAIHRQRFFQVFKHRNNIVGQNIFTAQRIAAADDQRRIVVVIEGVFDIQAQRFRLRPGSLVRSRTAIRCTLAGIFAIKWASEKGRNRCTETSPTFSRRRSAHPPPPGWCRTLIPSQ